jgi:hypothetical protein
VALVQRGRLPVQTLAIALVSLAQGSHVGLELLHCRHRSGLAERERQQDQVHRGGERSDGEGVGGPERVEASE